MLFRIISKIVFEFVLSSRRNVFVVLGRVSCFGSFQVAIFRFGLR